MALNRSVDTALGAARGRFVASLPKKARELGTALERLTPGDNKGREDLRRRLHALYASAQVFRLADLQAELHAVIARLDASRDEGRDLSEADLAAVRALVGRVAGLSGAAEDHSEVSKPTFDPAVLSEPSPRVEPILRQESDQGPAVKNVVRVAGSKPPPVPPQAAASSTVPSAAAGEPPRAQLGAATPAPTVDPGLLVSALIVGDQGLQTHLRGQLPAEQFEVVCASESAQAAGLARSTAPDVVLVDPALPGLPDFLKQLRGDPLTNFVPVVFVSAADQTAAAAMAEELGVTDVISRTTSTRELLTLLNRIASGVVNPAVLTGGFGNLTIEELADRVGEEVRRGLVQCASEGRNLRVPLGQGDEVLAAVWSAIARVRASVVQKSGGRVRFRDGAERGRPAMLALSNAQGAPLPAERAHIVLQGRRAVVADDDPAVVWFFTGLLRDVGMEVIECTDGLAALEAARNIQPDLILSDIVMPRLDGLGLCRELQRDPALRDVPVILLSWKEDFLQRMRELQSGASGYLRKEAAGEHILASVREVLRPRSRLEQQLRADGEVRGRVETTGAIVLLATVSAFRPNARVVVRDPWNLFEVDLRDGKLAGVTRTATDGSFSRGKSALRQLLACPAGRFSVTASDAPVRGSLHGEVEMLVFEAIADLRSVIDAVSGHQLAKVRRVDFDEELLGAAVVMLPPTMRQLIDKIRDGVGPADLIAEGICTQETLQSALEELARRGAIRAVQRASSSDQRREPASLPSPPPATGEGAVRISSPAPEEPTRQSPLGWLRAELSARDSLRPGLPSEVGNEDVTKLAKLDDPFGDRRGTTDTPLVPPPPPEEIDSISEPPTVEAHITTTKVNRPSSGLSLGITGWVLVGVVMGTLSFAGLRLWQWFRHEQQAPIGAADGVSLGQKTTAPAPVQALASSRRGGEPTGSPRERPLSGSVDLEAMRFGSTLSLVADAGVLVAPDQGLLVIQGDRVDGRFALRDTRGGRRRMLGRAPVSIALPESVYQLSLIERGRIRHRFVHVRQGTTRLISSDSWKP